MGDCYYLAHTHCSATLCTLVAVHVSDAMTIDKELLYAIRAMDVLLESGAGIETAMKHVAENDYGELSRIFKEILAESKVRYLNEILRERVERECSEGLRRVLNAIAMSSKGTALLDQLRRIADKEFDERKVKLEKFTERLTSISEVFLILSILIPIIVVSIAFIDAVVSKTPFRGGVMLGNQLTVVLLGLDLLLLFFLVTLTKHIEPEV